MCRNGKIARLPRVIRDQLNRRLADGAIGSRLVTWLNGLPEVKTVLKEDFGGRPITEDNLSEWRKGGFEDWLRHEDARDWATQLTEESDDLVQVSGSVSLPERAAYPALLALSGLIRQVLVSADPAEQRRTVISAAQQLTQLRRVFLQAERQRLDKERWETAKSEAHHREERQAELLRLERERTEMLRQQVARETALFAQYDSDPDPRELEALDAHRPKSD